MGQAQDLMPLCSSGMTVGAVHCHNLTSMAKCHFSRTQKSDGHKVDNSREHSDTVKIFADKTHNLAPMVNLAYHTEAKIGRK